VPAAADYPLEPQVRRASRGARGSAGARSRRAIGSRHVKGQVTADVLAPDFGSAATWTVQNLDLAPLLQDPAQRSDITGQATLDMRMASAPENAPVDRPDVRHLRVHRAARRRGGVRGAERPRDGSLDGHASTSMGARRRTAARPPPAASSWRPRRAARWQFDLRGAADDVDLRDLPARRARPEMATNLSVAEYAVRGAGDNISGSARLNASTVEGATLAQGTTAEFSLTSKEISYSARGSASSAGPAARRPGARDRGAGRAGVREPPERRLRRDRQHAADAGGAARGRGARGTLGDHDADGQRHLPRFGPVRRAAPRVDVRDHARQGRDGRPGARPIRELQPGAVLPSGPNSKGVSAARST
jgi:hypothetical protein